MRRLTASRSPQTPAEIRLAVSCAVFACLIALISSLQPTIVNASDGVAPNLTFEQGVTEDDRILITEGIRLAQDYFITHLGLDPAAQVYVSARSTTDPTEPSITGFSAGRSIVLFTESDGWKTRSLAERLHTVVHEFTHFYQYIQSGDQYTSPIWFEEGAAELMATSILADTGLIDRGDFDAYDALLLHVSPPQSSLAALSEIARFQAAGADVYPYAYFAVASLLGTHPDQLLAEYYGSIDAGESFDIAFASTFGIELATFYGELETYLDRLVMLPWVPDEFAEFVPVVQPATVQWLAKPDTLLLDQQSVFIGYTEPGTVCLLSLDLPATVTPVERNAVANGAGEVFWLVTIPTDGDIGAAEVTISCGGKSSTIDLLIAAA